jgi:hypothetical protein
VRAGVSKKVWGSAPRFYADRPRTRISLSIAQREYVDKFIEFGIAEHRAAGIDGQIYKTRIAE